MVRWLTQGASWGCSRWPQLKEARSMWKQRAKTLRRLCTPLRNFSKRGFTRASKIDPDPSPASELLFNSLLYYTEARTGVDSPFLIRYRKIILLFEAAFQEVD